MKKLLCVLICLPLYLSAQRTSLRNYLSINLAKTFTSLSKEDIRTQHPQRNTPIAVYRHQREYNATWSFTLNENRWPIADTTIIQSFWKAKLQEMYGQSIRFVQPSTSSVSLPYVSFAFIVSRGNHAVSARRYYHYIQHIILDAQELVIHFICPITFYHDHLQLIEDIIASISEKK